MLDRMVHLLSRGCVLPVVNYIRKCWEMQDTDISLIRHFVTEVGLGAMHKTVYKRGYHRLGTFKVWQTQTGLVVNECGPSSGGF